MRGEWRARASASASASEAQVARKPSVRQIRKLERNRWWQVGNGG